MASSFKLPTAAFQGFKNAAAYDTHRPSYPQEAVDTLLSRLNLTSVAGGQSAKMVEIASGTGKFTELLVAKPGLEIIAVEPHEGMRAQLAAKNLEAVTVLDGHAGKLPVEDGWADGYLAAQSFHWWVKSL